jgi:hypothetical protein
MTSNEMWHIERMGAVLRNLGLPWFSVDVYSGSFNVKVLDSDCVTLYNEMHDWNEDEDGE